MARAKSSLPVPLSPRIRTGISLWATWRAVLNDLLHRLAGADDAFEAGSIARDFRLSCSCKHLILLLQRGLGGGTIDLGPEILQIERLFDEIERAEVHCLLVRPDRTVGCHKDDRRGRLLLFRPQ